MVAYEYLINHWNGVGACLKRSAGISENPGALCDGIRAINFVEFSEGGNWLSDCLPTWYRPEVEYASLV